MLDEYGKDGAKRDRSPKFPYISLPKAIERIEVLHAKAKRYEVRVSDIAKDWDLSAKSSSTDRTVAAIQSFGLIEDSGSGENRKIKLSELGARIIADSRPGVREALIAEAAVKPPIISDYRAKWSEGRPDDSHALSQLQFEGKFTAEAAKIFLRVFDETVALIGQRKADSEADSESPLPSPVPIEAQSHGEAKPQNGPIFPTAPAQIVAPLTGEREWLRGPLSKEASYRLFVAGELGPREIGKLIKLLEAQKSILEDDS